MITGRIVYGNVSVGFGPEGSGVINKSTGQALTMNAEDWSHFVAIMETYLDIGPNLDYYRTMELDIRKEQE